MDPQFNKEPALRLPQPIPEHAAWQPVPSGAQEQAPNFELATQPTQGVPMTTSLQGAAQQFQPLQQMTPMGSAPAAPQASATTPQAATTDLNDERVWVERAKRIVEQTHTDPYLESQEIGKFKAEYLKDVHAKNIKVAEG